MSGGTAMGGTSQVATGGTAGSMVVDAGSVVDAVVGDAGGTGGAGGIPAAMGPKTATPAELLRRMCLPRLTWPRLKMSGLTFHSLPTRICRLILAWSHRTPPRLERRMLAAQTPATVPEPEG
jgi:hypothetical protein